jgi:hypothetical protein
VRSGKPGTSHEGSRGGRGCGYASTWDQQITTAASDAPEYKVVASNLFMNAAQLRPAASEEQSVVARYEALIRVSQAVSAYREPQKLFDVLVDELRRVIEFDGIGIAQYDETKDAIEWHVSIHCDEPNPTLKDK